MNYKQSLFPELLHQTYLNHAAISPLNKRAFDAMNDLMLSYARVGVSAWSEGNELRISLREKLARFIGAQDDQIGLISNTSHGLVLVANEYPWQVGDSLVLFRGEFPGNVLPWLAAAHRYQLEVIWLDLEDLATQSENFQVAMAQKPRLMAISWVQFQTGITQSLAELSAMRQAYDIHICLDAIQGLGPLTLDLKETPLDFVVCGGHKWLLSPEGTGFIYVHPQLMATLEPTMVSWISQQDASSFLFKGAGFIDYEGPLKKDPKRFEMATMNAFGFAGMEASIDLFLEVGPATIQNRIAALAERCRQGLRDRGLSVVVGEHCAGNVCFPLPGENLVRVVKGLEERGIIVSTPDGHLRCAAHFYNDEADIDRYLEALDELL